MYGSGLICIAIKEHGETIRTALADLTEVLRANGAARNAMSEQPAPADAPEGRYLQGRCDCTLSVRYQWYEDEFCWRDDRSGDPPKGSHCERCGAKLPSPEWCAQRGLEPGTAVAFAEATESDEGVRAALARANEKLAKASRLAHACLEAMIATGQAPGRIYQAIRDISDADLTEEAATDAD